MATILADRDIERLLGTVLVGGDKACLSPNGLRLRLGKHVRFHSTAEVKELDPGLFLKVSPGETVVISSLETIDFTATTVQAFYPESMLMGFITPTTTMMREGISQVATKIDAGFRGTLNWGLRNGSTKDLILEYGEPIFKLTIFRLEEDEVPDQPYGARENDSYQDSVGVVRSARRIPSDIPKDKIVSSSFGKLDPRKQLRQAGYPFDHIATELVSLHGKFEVVSKDVTLLRDQFQKQTDELSQKITSETKTLSGKLQEFRETFFRRVEALFDRKFLRVVGVIIGTMPVMYGGLSFLSTRGVPDDSLWFIAVIVGLGVILITCLLTRRVE